MTPVAERPRRTYRPGLAYPPRPGSGYAPEDRPPTRFTPYGSEHLAQIRWARDVLGFQRWELEARFARLDQASHERPRPRGQLRGRAPLAVPMTRDCTTATLTAACLDKIRSHRHVSFPELARILDSHGVPSTGDIALLAARPNVVLWASMSDQFYAVVDELLLSGAVEFAATHWLTYLCDGAIPAMPIAKRPPKGGYRKPHWLPVVFNPTPAVAPSSVA